MTYKFHDPATCVGRFCAIHNPSEHHMVNWPINIRLDNKALVERICECGVGHPDPDSVAYFERKGITHMGIHGCCGHCTQLTDVVKSDKLNSWTIKNVGYKIGRLLQSLLHR